MTETNQDLMDKCPIDGNFFVPKAGKKVCSPKCKKLWDSQVRRQRRLAEKLEAERMEATAEANREAENAKRRKARAEKRAQDNKVQYETPEEAAKFGKFSRAEVIGWAVFAVIIGLLIWGLPN
jgi:hypothetical protein